MTIETKFEPTNQVYVLDRNKIQIRKIRFIKITTRHNEEKERAISSSLANLIALQATPDHFSVISYIMYPVGDNKDLKEEFKESECFYNKEALIKSL